MSDEVSQESLKALDELIDNVGKVDTIICTPDDWDRIKQLRQNNGFKFEYGWADRIYIPKEFNALED